ncbi:MAG: hypothetical protein Q9201_000897 [Fulgogasparrea decipioides]
MSQTLQTTSQLDFLKSHSATTTAKAAILHVVSAKVSQALNQSNYTFAGLRNCEPVKPGSGPGIYAIIYFLPQEVYVYIGSIVDMWKRHSEHEISTKDWKIRHYRIARQASWKAVIVVAKITNAHDWQLRFAEQLMILFRFEHQRKAKRITG